MSFQLGREMMDAAPFSYKERVRVAWDGVTVLDGTVRKCDAALSASGYVWQVEICVLSKSHPIAALLSAVSRMEMSVSRT